MAPGPRSRQGSEAEAAAAASAEGSGRTPLTLVVGGGFTGAAFLVHAIRSAQGPQTFAVLEPSDRLGRGLAYGTDDPLHRINVPTDRLSLFVDDPTHATRWFFAQGLLPDGSSTDAAGNHYVPRRHYGAYVADVLRDTLAEAGPGISLRHHRTTARAIARRAGRWLVTLADERVVAADRVVLAFGHTTPQVPFPLSPQLIGHGSFVPDPFAPKALAGIGPDHDVLIVGTGLTMVDIALSLKASGHRGHLTAVSRKGLLPQPQGHFIDACALPLGDDEPLTASRLLRRLRARAAEEAGRLGWHPVVDALRRALPHVWQRLPLAERRRIARHLLPFWDVHRFRIAPQARDALDALFADGSLIVKRATLVGLAREHGQCVASLRRPNGEIAREAHDAVILCTGPGRSWQTSGFGAALLRSGHARLDGLGMGLDVDPSSRVLDRGGRIQPDLVALGPMTRGSFGEMTGAPDIVRHIQRHAASWMADGPTARASAEAPSLLEARAS